MNKTDPFTGRLGSKKAKHLFENAATDDTTNRLFELVKALPIEQVQELRPEPAKLNPFEAIDERNHAMDQARYDASLVSDPTQTLVKGPSAAPIAAKSETVTLEELPAIVRQAAEAALIKKLTVRARK